MRLLLVSVVLAGLCAGVAGAETRISVFAGTLTDNRWERIVFTPWQTRIQRPGLVGVAVTHPFGRSWQTRAGELRFEIEGQIVRHFGPQTHWEANLPLTLRLTPERPVFGVIDTLAFGIGPSYATRPPAFERQRGRGNAARALIYWHAEAEHRLSGGDQHLCPAAPPVGRFRRDRPGGDFEQPRSGHQAGLVRLRAQGGVPAWQADVTRRWIVLRVGPTGCLPASPRERAAPDPGWAL